MLKVKKCACIILRIQDQHIVETILLLSWKNRKDVEKKDKLCVVLLNIRICSFDVTSKSM